VVRKTNRSLVENVEGGELGGGNPLSQSVGLVKLVRVNSSDIYSTYLNCAQKCTKVVFGRAYVI